MADKPTKVIYDCATGVTEVVELTDDEIAELAAAQAAYEAAAAAQAKADADRAALRQSAIAKLQAGTRLTADEAALIVAP